MNRKQKFIKWLAEWLGVEIFFEQMKQPIIPAAPLFVREVRFEPFRIEARQTFNRHDVYRMQQLGIDIPKKMKDSVCDKLYQVYEEDFDFYMIEGPEGTECAVRLEIWKSKK